MDIKAVSAPTLERLIVKILADMAAGWELRGEICRCETPGGAYVFYQILTKGI
jgi:hypothetical protein